MNFRLVTYIIGQIMRVEGLLMLLPYVCALIYGEASALALAIPIALLILFGTLMTFREPGRRDQMTARDGLLIVGLAWIVMSLFGMLPFLLSGTIANPADAFFETVSGFTTTGATVLGEATGVFPEDLDRGIALWRSFTHWIGGMGVLVFVLAVMPQQNFKSARLMHVMRAEVPGPITTKVVATIRHSARIMYEIYIGMTLLETILLMFGGMSLYDALLHSFSTAGTGGFSNMSASIGAFDNSYIHWVITVFMLLFSVNFNLYYLILIGRLTQALKSEEIRWFLLITGASAAIITISILPQYEHASIALRDASFTVASIISTTGFGTANYEMWPQLAQIILVLLMFVGACTGSTCGGLKIGRLVILFKSAFRELHNMIHPREVRMVRSEGKVVEEETVRSVHAYFALYMLILTASVLLLILLHPTDFLTAFTAVASCLNNVGPGMGKVGPTLGASFGFYHTGAKLLLSLDMLLGRLEIFPILILFMPTTWRKK